MTRADVVVSVVCDDNRRRLEDCVASLARAGTRRSWRLVVTVNASADGTLEAARRLVGPPGEVIVNGRRFGFGANHNRVLRKALADGARHALVLNDDTVLDPGAIDALADRLESDAGLGAVAPVSRDGQGRVRPVRLAYPDVRSSWAFDRRGVTEEPDPGGWLQGSCLLVRLAALAQVGLFDERFFLFYEDVDLSRRLQAGGWGLADCPTASLTHLGHETVMRADLAAFTPRQGRHSRYLYLRKHHGPGPAHLVASGGRALLAVRAAESAFRAVRTRDRRRLREARALLGLAAYDPRRAPAVPAAQVVATTPAAARPLVMQAGIPTPR